MLEEQGIVKKNQCIALDTYEMVIEATMSKQMTPGQFVEIKLAEYSLRRPISIASIDDGQFTIVYKVVGEGTRALTKYQVNQTIDLLGPAGHGFPIHDDLTQVLLIGGGAGVPPLYEVAKQYRAKNISVTVVLGFQNKETVFYADAFKALGSEVVIATMDGSEGDKGTVMDAIQNHHITKAFVYACGPKPMLKAIEDTYEKGYISHEARMACGMGACMACVCKENKEDGHYRRICKDGPVFPLHEVIV